MTEDAGEVVAASRDRDYFQAMESAGLIPHTADAVTPDIYVCDVPWDEDGDC
jgi:hypothetical protein